MDVDPDLLRHLQAVTGLEEGLLAKVVGEVHGWYARDAITWLRQRHRELQRQGLRNREIYPRLQAELSRILVPAPSLSQRQIRRAIYG